MLKQKPKDLHDNQDFRRVLSSDTPFAITEAYRTLYTNVLYLPIDDECKRIAITSAESAEGKTSVSINLSISIALNSPESKVLLVNSDMRSPRLCKIMNISRRNHGLSEYLAGIDREPNIIKSNYTNLDILTSGAKNENALGLLASKRMEFLRDLCENNYDYIIVDTPPINLVSDALLLKDYVNGYIIVARSDFSNVNSVSLAKKKLISAEANVFGVILVSVDPKSNPSAYGKYGKYGNHYGYGHAEKRESHESDSQNKN